MSNRYFEYKGQTYPTYIRDGDAVHFIIPFAERFCIGKGLDIGGFSYSVFPGAVPVNIVVEDQWDAYYLPNDKYDYIFSSHTLEHLENYITALLYWKEHLKSDGVLFLYLPHPSMTYWLPQNNRRHVHIFHPADIHALLIDLGFKDVLSTERDLYWSFSVVGHL